jgi:hypothetical protein
MMFDIIFDIQTNNALLSRGIYAKSPGMGCKGSLVRIQSSRPFFSAPSKLRDISAP